MSDPGPKASSTPTAGRLLAGVDYTVQVGDHAFVPEAVVDVHGLEAIARRSGGRVHLLLQLADPANPNGALPVLRRAGLRVFEATQGPTGGVFLASAGLAEVRAVLTTSPEVRTAFAVPIGAKLSPALARGEVARSPSLPDGRVTLFVTVWDDVDLARGQALARRCATEVLSADALSHQLTVALPADRVERAARDLAAYDEVARIAQPGPPATIRPPPPPRRPTPGAQ